MKVGLSAKEPLLPSRTNGLTWDEFQRILGAIDGKHGFYDFPIDGEDADVRRWKGIKYIRPAIDLRDNRVFRVTFEGMSEKTFDERECGERMYDRIMAWLEGGDHV